MSAKKSATPKNLKQGSLFSFFSTKPKKPAAVAAASSKTTSKSSVPKLVTATRNTLTKTVTQTPSAKPTPSTEETRTPTNSVWKQVQVGYRLSVFWKDDRKYYPCTVTKVSQKTQFLLEYDDGETEQLDLSFEKFKILSTTKRRRIDDDDEDDEEHEWEDLEAESEEEDDGSVFEAPKEEEKDDEDEVDQWMVTDTEDNIPEEEDEAPPVKKRKTAKKTFKVTQHEAASIHTAASTTTSIKTPLRQFANTVSPSTASTHKSKQTPLMFSSSKDQRSASSPPAPRQLNPPTSKTNKPLDFVKGAVNPAGSHVHNHLNFLNYPRDKQGRAPTDPNYDPRTLKISSSEWERVYGGKMTNAVQQWWDLKSRYFDTVLLFKTGKFYEMFHMDADVGVNHCNLSYMKGHVAHAGYPEISYGSMADKLVRAGYKVARVEQTETPQQLAIRKQKTARGKKKPQVVNREVCSILTLGTRTFCCLDDENALLNSETNGSGVGPLLAIREVLHEMETDDEVPPVCEYGITLIDAVNGTMTLGQFADDVLRSRMNTLLTAFSPSEILVHSSETSPTLQSLLKAYQTNSRQTTRLESIGKLEESPPSTALDPTHRQMLQRSTSIIKPWHVEETMFELHRKGYYPRGSKTDLKSVSRWPQVLQAVVTGKAHLCLQSLGAALFYLQRNLIDSEIFGMGIVKAYIPPVSSCITPESQDTSIMLQQSQEEQEIGLESIPSPVSAEDSIKNLSLDGTTLHNLEILTNAVDHKPNGSLWSKINFTKTPHGARLLRAWLLRPLFRKADIDRRADAVQELVAGAGAVALNEVRQDILSKIGDLDRLLSRVHSMSGPGGMTSSGNEDLPYLPAERAVLYENATYTKRKVGDFSKLLNGLQKSCSIPDLFADLQVKEGGLLEKVARSTKNGGFFPEMTEELDWYFENFDCVAAAKGEFEPSRGCDPAYDEACDMIERIKEELEEYRQEMCNSELTPRHVAKSSWKYVNTKPDSKDKYLIELPASLQVPSEFVIKGKRGSGLKKVHKYRTSHVAGLVIELERALEVKAKRKAKGLQLIFAKFDSQRSLWAAAAHATSLLDALGSLAKTAGKSGYCRPTILECPIDQEPSINIVQGRHPCVENSSTDFIPNDLNLGRSDSSRLLLLSGPNMGGKSTLLRQTCLIAILAQIGSYVPADSCELTPMDCIYTRLGASDRILLGQSTFFVELAETAAALRGATRRSLVIMDELGRGTSTFDGTAIAGATVKHLVERSQCMSLFATHYHSLLSEWEHEPKVRLGHMECMVDDESEDDHNITFLYTLGPGTCPKSFGINVARLASLPPQVLTNAKLVSEEFEQEMNDRHNQFVVSPENALEYKEKIMKAIEAGDWQLLKQLQVELKGSANLDSS